MPDQAHRKCPAGGPQLKKSGGPELRKSGGPQPRKSPGPQTEEILHLDELPEEFTIVNHTGTHRAKLIVHENCIEPLRKMGNGFVTEHHSAIRGFLQETCSTNQSMSVQ